MASKCISQISSPRGHAASSVSFYSLHSHPGADTWLRYQGRTVRWCPASEAIFRHMGTHVRPPSGQPRPPAGCGPPWPCRARCLPTSLIGVPQLGSTVISTRLCVVGLRALKRAARCSPPVAPCHCLFIFAFGSWGRGAARGSLTRTRSSGSATGALDPTKTNDWFLQIQGWRCMEPIRRWDPCVGT